MLGSYFYFSVKQFIMVFKISINNVTIKEKVKSTIFALSQI